MTRHGERQIQRVREVSDRQLVVRERMHEGEPDRVRENLEDFRGFAEYLRGGKAVLRRLDFCRADDFGKRVSGMGYHS